MLIPINFVILGMLLDSIHIQCFNFKCCFGKNVVIFGADNSSPMHFDNIYEDNLILGEVSTRKLDDTTIIAEVK